MVTILETVRTACLLSVLAWALPASGFVDDFESGSLARWQATSAGGMTAEASAHNGSIMASLLHSGGGRSSLSIDFPYSRNGYVGFDMQSIPIRVAGNFGSVLDAGGGVTISFSNAFNVVLGTASFYSVTNPASLAAHEFLVDSSQHNYSATMAELAALAGLTDADPIAKVNLRFAAWALFQSGGNIYPNHASYATVWFDNVTVTEFDAQIECLLNWAERTYPSDLAASRVDGTRFSSPYTYRYYNVADAYVGVSTRDNHVYYLGADRTMQDLGPLDGWLGTAACR